MGGLLGLLLASRQWTPVRRLVMNDIGAYVPLQALLAIARNLDAPERFTSIEEVEAHMRRTHREWGDIADEQWKAIARHGSRPDGDGFRLHYDPQIARLMHAVPVSPGLFSWGPWYRVRCPVLLLRGESSRIFPASVARAMLDSKANARLVEIPGCGHVPSLMAESHIAIVRDFLQGDAVRQEWQPPSYSYPGSSRMRTSSPRRSMRSARPPPAALPT